MTASHGSHSRLTSAGSKHRPPFGEKILFCRTDSGFSAASVFAWLGRRPARFHAHELQSEPAYQVEDAIQMGLIADLTDEGGVLGTGLQV